MLDQVQLIEDKEQIRFAVIPYDEYLLLKEMLNDPEKLADYLDYLHMQQVKKEENGRFSLAEVKKELAL